MDPITTIIVAALSQLSIDVIRDGYLALKNSILQKYGSDSKVSNTLMELEKKPASSEVAAKLSQELTVSGGVNDQKLIELSSNLGKTINNVKNSSITNINVDIKGSAKGVIGSENVNVDSITFTDHGDEN